LPYKLHKNVGPNDLLVVCPGCVGRACCMCEERKEVYNDPDIDDDDAKALNASARTLYIIKMKSGVDKGEIKIMDISDYCFRAALDEELDDLPEEYEDFACLEDGYTIEVRFKEESFGTIKFPKANKITFIEREDYDESILEEVPCLDDLIDWPSSQKLEKLFLGESPDDAEDDDEPGEEETEENEDDIELTWDDLSEMDLSELLEVIEHKEIEIDEDEADDAEEDELRDFIAGELGIKKPLKKKGKKKAKKVNKKDKKEKKGKVSKKSKKAEKTTKNAMKCPYMYQFGTDFEEHDECDEDTCDMYEECLDAFENE